MITKFKIYESLNEPQIGDYEIEYFSPNKSDVEAYLVSKKYNL